jgi:hypothetical protein
MLADEPPQARLNDSVVKRYSTPDTSPSRVTHPPVLKDQRRGPPDMNRCWVTMVAVTRYYNQGVGGQKKDDQDSATVRVSLSHRGSSHLKPSLRQLTSSTQPRLAGGPQQSLTERRPGVASRSVGAEGAYRREQNWGEGAGGLGVASTDPLPPPLKRRL